LANLYYILGVAGQRGVLLGVVSRQVRLARPNVIKDNYLVVDGQGGSQVLPDALVATEAIAEQHRWFALSHDADAVSF
jgi:hypothetical protein